MFFRADSLKSQSQKKGINLDKQQIFEDINAKIIANLEQGKMIWRKPWQTGLPANFISRRIYQGLNFLFLSFDEVANPFYLTFLQAQQKELRIKKGSKGRLITFYKLHQFENVTDKGVIESKQFPLLKFSYVFNLEDLEGYEIPQPTLSAPLDMLNGILQLHAPEMKHNLSRCFYSESENCISTPAVDKFTNEEEYFSALFHELVHWTGHPVRLNRAKHQKFGDEVYAYEELIAEIGSSYMLGLCGIENTLANASGYLDGWLRKAKGDSSYILSASIQAQKAVNYLISQKEAAV